MVATTRRLLLALGAPLAVVAASSTVEGYAGTVPSGYVEVCVLLAELPSAARRSNGDLPSPYAKLTYNTRSHETPEAAETLNPNWDRAGCMTTQSAAGSKRDDAGDIVVELYDDRGVLYSARLLAQATLRDEPGGRWEALSRGDVSGARAYVMVTPNPADDDDSDDGALGDRFKSLTTTEAYFAYVGAALGAILVCVCCIFGKGRMPARAASPKQPIATSHEPSAAAAAAPAKRFVWPGFGRGSGERQPANAAAADEGGASSRRPSRPNLTIEVRTPPAAREIDVVPVNASHSTG